MVAAMWQKDTTRHGTVCATLVIHIGAWLNTDKYAFLDKFRAIKSILYTEQGAQSSQVGNTNWKLRKALYNRESGMWGRACMSLGIARSPHSSSTVTGRVSQKAT